MLRTRVCCGSCSQEGDWQLQSGSIQELVKLEWSELEMRLFHPVSSYADWSVEPNLLFHQPLLCGPFQPDCFPIYCGASALLCKKKKKREKVKKLLLEKDGAWRIPAWERNISELISPGEEEIIFVTSKGCFFTGIFLSKLSGIHQNPTA